MSKYHSTITRRDFMKALGLGAAGAATVGAASPIFRDLDELTSSAPKTDNPWWVRTRETNKPKNEIDWSILKKLDQREYPMPQTNQTEIITKAYEFIAEGCNKKIPGRTTRDLAMTRGIASRDSLRFDLITAWNGVPNINPPLFGLPATNPWSSWWPPKWESTPEDNFQTVRAAIHCLGGNHVGALKLDEKSEKLLYWFTGYDANETNGRLEVNPSSAALNRIWLPPTAKYIVTWQTHQNFMYNRHLMSKDETGTMPGGIGYNNPLGFGTYRAYHDAHRLEYYMSRFLQCIGYKVFFQLNQNTVVGAVPFAQIPASSNVNIPFGIFAGIGELSRSSMMMTPSSGTSHRMTCALITDFPVAPTNPIDFGGIEFCSKCKKCGEVCRGGAISMENKGTYDNNPVKGQRPGYFSWKLDWDACKKGGGNTDCGNCFIVCPFNHPNEALIHPAIRIVSANTSIFNSFFADADRWMQYVKPMTDKEQEAWWYRDYRTYKGDTLIQGGTYRWVI